MQCSRLTACAFPFLTHRLPVSLQRVPNWFPILRRRFHDYFLGLLLEQPCGQRSQLFGVAAKHPPLKPELTVNFHVRHNYGQHLFMNINSRYPVRHKLLLAGSGERAAVTLTRVAGYRRSPRGEQRRPIIRSITHAPDQTILRSQLLQREFDLAAPGRCYLTSTSFSSWPGAESVLRLL